MLCQRDVPLSAAGSAQMTETPPLLSVARPDAPVPLVDLIRRCLEKDPTKRPQTATEIIHSLDQALVSSGTSSLGAGAAPAVVAPKRSKVMLAIAFAAMFVIANRGSIGRVTDRNPLAVGRFHQNLALFRGRRRS